MLQKNHKSTLHVQLSKVLENKKKNIIKTLQMITSAALVQSLAFLVCVYNMPLHNVALVICYTDACS